MLLQRGQKLPLVFPRPRPDVSAARLFRTSLDRSMHILAQLTARLPELSPDLTGPAGPCCTTPISVRVLPLSGGLPGISHRLFHIGPRPPRKQITGFSFMPIPSDFSVWVLDAPLASYSCGDPGEERRNHLARVTWFGEDAVLCVAPQHWAPVGAPASP